MDRAVKNATQRIVSIQVCRGLAALLVVLAHLNNIEKKYFPTNLTHLFQHGVLGVDMFFVISGVVISAVTHGRFKSAKNAVTFLYHRFARVYPVYWVYSTLVLTAYLYNPMWINAKSGHKVNILSSYLLIPTHLAFLVLQGWTLSFEIYFYLVFFIVLMLPARKAAWALVAWGGVVIVLKFWLGLTSKPIIDLLTSPLVLEFLAGCAIFHIYRRIHLHRRAGILLIVTSCLWLVGVITYNSYYFAGDVARIESDPWLRPALYGTFSVLFLFGAMELERSGLVRYFKFLEAVGNWSYSIYLCHLILLELLGRAAFRFANNWHYSIFVIDAVSIPMVLVAGYLSYSYLEKPLMLLLYKRKLSQTA